ncbi:MAG: hypothetical protein KatS3mg061_2175 [Dehalococcoidia bacterium]|jgi:PPOX class probable F420-dependent enzyme|nr:MAG: hypothetical protein KatS3mg061_2175 [Dehalococcoidia bacterium]
MVEQRASFPTLQGHGYAALTTFRRDGRPVTTPVWFADDGKRLLFVTRAGAGKLKRIAHTPRVLVAPCTVSGKLLGPTVAGEAALLSGEDARLAERALLRKYRLLGWLFLRLGWFGRRRAAVFFAVCPLAE